MNRKGRTERREDDGRVRRSGGKEKERRREDTFAVKPVLKCTTTVTVSKDQCLTVVGCLLDFL